MSELFSEDFRFNAAKTNDSELSGEPAVATPDELIEYLNADPRHAVVLHGSKDNWNGKVTYDQPLYVLRGASDAPDNFYWGEWPAEDPNDAEGGDLTAEAALSEATISYYE